jgi:hypothetical protein
VGDFERGEADAFFDAAGVLVGDEAALRERVFGSTTRPGALQALALRLKHTPRASEAIVRAFVDDNFALAEERVSNMLRVSDDCDMAKHGLRFRQLITDMLANGGRLPTKATMQYMLPADQVVPVLEKYPAVVYDPTAREYKFSTPSDALAANSASVQLVQAPALPLGGCSGLTGRYGQPISARNHAFTPSTRRHQSGRLRIRPLDENREPRWRENVATLGVQLCCSSGWPWHLARSPAEQSFRAQRWRRH